METDGYQYTQWDSIQYCGQGEIEIGAYTAFEIDSDTDEEMPELGWRLSVPSWDESIKAMGEMESHYDDEYDWA